MDGVRTQWLVPCGSYRVAAVGTGKVGGGREVWSWPARQGSTIRARSAAC